MCVFLEWYRRFITNLRSKLWEGVASKPQGTTSTAWANLQARRGRSSGGVATDAPSERVLMLLLVPLLQLSLPRHLPGIGRAHCPGEQVQG